MAKKHSSTAKQQLLLKRKASQSAKQPLKELGAKGVSPWLKIFSEELASAGEKFKAIHTIENGMDVMLVDQIAETLELPAMAIRQLIKITPSTFSRRQKAGTLSPEESDRIYRLQSVIGKATDFYEGNKAAARKWLNTPAPALGGVRPISMLVNEAGVREVESLLGRLEYGVFT